MFRFLNKTLPSSNTFEVPSSSSVVSMAGLGSRGDRGAFMVVVEDALLGAFLVIEDDASFETGKLFI